MLPRITPITYSWSHFHLLCFFESSQKLSHFIPLWLICAFIALVLNRKTEFLPRNLGANLHCTLDIMMTEIVQSTTLSRSFPLFKSLQCLWTSLVVQWLRLCFQCRGCEFDPWSGSEDPMCLWSQKPRTKTTEAILQQIQ